MVIIHLRSLPIRTSHMRNREHWKPRVVVMPTLSSLAAPQVVETTTCGATTYKIGIAVMMPTLSLQVVPQVALTITCIAASDDKVGMKTTLVF